MVKIESNHWKCEKTFQEGSKINIFSYKVQYEPNMMEPQMKDSH